MGYFYSILFVLLIALDTSADSTCHKRAVEVLNSHIGTEAFEIRGSDNQIYPTSRKVVSGFINHVNKNGFGKMHFQIDGTDGWIEVKNKKIIKINVFNHDFFDVEPDCQLGRYYTKGRSKVLFHDKEICDLYKSLLSEVDGSFADVKKCAAFEGILDNLDKKIIAKEKESELRFYIQSSERKSLSGFGQLADRCIRMETSYPSTLDNNKGVLSSFRDNYLKRETSTRTPNAKPSEVTR